MTWGQPIPNQPFQKPLKARQHFLCNCETVADWNQTVLLNHASPLSANFVRCCIIKKFHKLHTGRVDLVLWFWEGQRWMDTCWPHRQELLAGASSWNEHSQGREWDQQLSLQPVISFFETAVVSTTNWFKDLSAIPILALE